MRTIFTFIFLIISTAIFSQMPPVVGTPTVLPSSPSSTSNVKIITETTTAYYGARISVSQNVDQVQKKIKLEGCYSTSMLPATRTYIDTFSVGFLQAGLYSVEFVAYESAVTQSCVVIASSSVAISMLVTGGTTALTDELPSPHISVAPNPFNDSVKVLGLHGAAELELRAINGALILKRKVHADEELNLSFLKAGIYFIQTNTGNGRSVCKLVKTESN